MRSMQQLAAHVPLELMDDEFAVRKEEFEWGQLPWPITMGDRHFNSCVVSAVFQSADSTDSWRRWESVTRKRERETGPHSG